MLDTSRGAKLEDKTCGKCHGNGRFEDKLLNLGTRNFDKHVVPCDMCNGGGIITQAIRDRYYASFNF